MITTNALSRMIYLQDSMNTRCGLYEGMENEYDMEAVDIIDMLKIGIPFRNAYFSSLSHFFWNDWVFKKEYKFFFIQAEYYNFLSKHQPGAAIFPASPEIRPELTALSVSNACDAMLVTLSESIQTGACKSMKPARIITPNRYAPPRRS